MALQTFAQTVQQAKNAGFSGNGLATIVAIALRENNGQFVTDSINSIPAGCNGVPSHAQGILQFVPSCHPDVNALDPQASFNYAYYLTKGGQDFSAWTCDTECGFPKGQGIVPTSPATVFAAGATPKPIALPGEFVSLFSQFLSGVNPTVGQAANAIGQNAVNGTPSVPCDGFHIALFLGQDVCIHKSTIARGVAIPVATMLIGIGAFALVWTHGGDTIVKDSLKAA